MALSCTCAVPWEIRPEGGWSPVRPVKASQMWDLSWKQMPSGLGVSWHGAQAALQVGMNPPGKAWTFWSGKGLWALLAGMILQPYIAKRPGNSQRGNEQLSVIYGLFLFLIIFTEYTPQRLFVFWRDRWDRRNGLSKKTQCLCINSTGNFRVWGKATPSIWWLEQALALWGVQECKAIRILSSRFFVMENIAEGCPHKAEALCLHLCHTQWQRTSLISSLE